MYRLSLNHKQYSVEQTSSLTIYLKPLKWQKQSKLRVVSSKDAIANTCRLDKVKMSSQIRVLKLNCKDTPQSLKMLNQLRIKSK